MTIVESSRPVTGGVDTHLDVHVAAAVDAGGGVLGVETFATTPAGYAELHGWLARFGDLARVGVEGTGAYGAGLARYLRAQDLEVIEVDRPNRQLRRRSGKSDTIDAIEAARAALSGRAAGIAKTADGDVEAIRVLLVARRSARDVRIKYMNQIRHLGFTELALTRVAHHWSASTAEHTLTTHRSFARERSCERGVRSVGLIMPGFVDRSWCGEPRLDVGGSRCTTRRSRTPRLRSGWRCSARRRNSRWRGSSPVTAD
jgi:hypothetical protein